MTILLRQPSGGFAAREAIPAGGGAFDVAARDLDGDGRTDLAITDYSANQLTVLLGQAGGGFAEEAGSPIAVGTRPLEVVAHDFNHDGLADLAVANHGSDDVTVLLRQPGGGFAAEPGSPVPAGHTPYGLAAADFDRDGDFDLAVTDEDANAITLPRRQPLGGFAAGLGSPTPRAEARCARRRPTSTATAAPTWRCRSGWIRPRRRCST